MTVKTRAELKTENATDFPDNATRLISAADLRGQMDDTADSMLMDEDIAGLDLSEAVVTATADGTMTLAEWTAEIGGSGSSEGALYQTRSAAMASTIAGTVNGIETLGYATPGDFGGAHYKRVASAPTHSGKFQSADGAWWELAELEVTLEMFGGKADGTNWNQVITGTDNWPAFQAALGYGVSPLLNSYSSSASIRLGRGIYHVSQTIEISRNVRISGSGGAAAGNNHPESILTFPPNVTGIKYWDWGIPDPALGGAMHGKSPYGSILENVRLWGQGGIFTDRVGTGAVMDKHGIVMFTTITMRNVIVANFAGDGIHILSSSPQGSANELDFFAMRLMLNGRHGIFIQGADTSAGGGIRMDVATNGGWGIYDSCFLNNTWTDCHANNNGVRNRVFHINKIYTCVAADDSLGGATTPGTNPAVWEFLQNGGEDPEWSPQWIPGGNYITGGAFYADGPSSHVMFIGCYSEGLQGWSRVNANSQCLGGFHGTPVKGSLVANAGQGLVLDGSDSRFGMRFGTDILQPSKPGPVRPGTHVHLAQADHRAISVIAVGDNTQGLSFPRWNDTTGTYDVAHGTLTTNPVMKFTSELTKPPADAGRSSGLKPGSVMFPNHIYVGQTPTDCRMISFSSGIPATGPVYARGDIVFNQAPSSAGNVGWICTQGGVIASIPAWPGAGAGEYAAGQYTKNSAGRFYLLLFDPAAFRSTSEPTHVYTFPNIAPGDGYEWVWVGGEGSAPMAGTLWVSGTDYDTYLNSHIRNAAGTSYACSTDPGGGVPSTVQPSHASGTVIGADGYGWRAIHVLWTTGTNYAVGDLVRTASNNVYRCTVDPGGATPSTIAPTQTPMQMYPDLYGWEYLCNPATTPAWTTGTNYQVGDVVENVGLQYFYRVMIKGPGVCTVKPFHVFAKNFAGFYGDGYRWDYLCSRTENYPWEFGFSYFAPTTNEWVERVFNAAGHAYRNRVARATSLLSTIEPVHTSGTVTSSDGHRWQWIADTSPIWKPWGVVEPTADVDSLDTLTAPSGGTITQLTSKATSVTLNKICGQITTHNAALAAATAVSFTLTNSKIAAADIVQISIVSGATAGAYDVMVDAVAAGSCRITIYNRTAGPLSEAIVLNFAILKGSLS